MSVTDVTFGCVSVILITADCCICFSLSLVSTGASLVQVSTGNTAPVPTLAHFPCKIFLTHNINTAIDSGQRCKKHKHRNTDPKNSHSANTSTNSLDHAQKSHLKRRKKQKLCVDCNLQVRLEGGEGQIGGEEEWLGSQHTPCTVPLGFVQHDWKPRLSQWRPAFDKI